MNVYFSSLLFCAFFTFLGSYSSAQSSKDEDYVTKNLKYDNFTYKPNIRTVQFHKVGFEYLPPIIQLNGGQQLELNFDDLDGEHKQYSIAFAFCNSDWSPSNLMVSEYLAGHHEINLINFTFSRNTFQKYTYYNILFPLNNVSFTKSGNYIVYVYENGNPEDLVLSRRFMVYDDKAKIDVTVRQPIAGEKQFNQQQIDFKVSGSNYVLNNPFKDLHVVVMQNHRWDNAVTDIKPTFLTGNTVEYSLNDALIFDGGNEFRYFDIRSTRFLTERVQEFYRDPDYTMNAVIMNEENKKNKPYLFYNDINGEYLIRNSETTGDQDIEADYVKVHFFIPYLEPETKGNFYLLGRVTDWRMNKTSKLTYNEKRFGYETTLYIKQGYYNYTYVLSNDDTGIGDHSIIDGSHFDTENEYDILVYHRQFGTYYDQLIGYRHFNSFKRE